MSLISIYFNTLLVDLFTFFFFFQAEDGIRDLTVTGVQTCALPIFPHLDYPQGRRKLPLEHFVSKECKGGKSATIWERTVKWMYNRFERKTEILDRKSVV